MWAGSAITAGASRHESGTVGRNFRGARASFALRRAHVRVARSSRHPLVGRSAALAALADPAWERRPGLAAQLREWADHVSDRWPRTGALLRQIADHFDEWARREDDQSERFRDDGS